MKSHNEAIRQDVVMNSVNHEISYLAISAGSAKQLETWLNSENDVQSALRQMAPDARVEHAQTDSGTYRGRIIADTEKNLIQQITSHTAVIHRKELLSMIPAIGENVCVAYSNDNGRVLPIKERSKTQELGR